jgi:hypothetical protein
VQVRAALALLGTIEDPFRLPRVLAALAPEARHQARACLGALRAFNPGNPTGSYVLNLSQPVDHAVAARLLTCWAVETRMGLCKPGELEARASLLLVCARSCQARVHPCCAGDLVRTKL